MKVWDIIISRSHDAKMFLNDIIPKATTPGVWEPYE